MGHKPTIKETKFLLPKPALSAKDIKPPQWVNMVQQSWEEVQGLSTAKAKAKVLETLSDWPLFGSSFFAVIVTLQWFGQMTPWCWGDLAKRLLGADSALAPRSLLARLSNYYYNSTPFGCHR